MISDLHSVVYGQKIVVSPDLLPPRRSESLQRWPAFVSTYNPDWGIEHELTTHILSLDTIPTEAVHPETSSSYFGSIMFQHISRCSRISPAHH